jgi:hypothetical protein
MSKTLSHGAGLREQLTLAICHALEPLSSVLAGWEGGSAAFGEVDAYSDIDLNFLIDDAVAVDLLYAAAESALGTVSPIVASHFVPPGRYYKLEAGGEFLLVDLCFFRVGAGDRILEIERHGRARPLFDKADWLRPMPLDESALAIKRNQRYQELHTWFAISQNFVRKAVLRGQSVEAHAFFSSYTLKPLAELLRMRHCPARWDFGMRYLDRDLPPSVYDDFRDLVFVRDLEDLDGKLVKATAWGLIFCSFLFLHLCRSYRPKIFPIPFPSFEKILPITSAAFGPRCTSHSSSGMTSPCLKYSV